MKHLFKKGHKFAKGGARPNPGPTPDWLKEKCRELVIRGKLIEYLHGVASGENVEVYVTQTGQVTKIPASTKNRCAATTMLVERGWGKSPQAIEVAGKDGEAVSWTININAVNPNAK